MLTDVEDPGPSFTRHVAGPLIDQGWSMDQIVAAIKRCADLIPELEAEVEEEGVIQ
tara:strand:- start:389 stop:556 length:168 start_codon:yes stop_codon:yes gene_type:complete